RVDVRRKRAPVPGPDQVRPDLRGAGSQQGALVAGGQPEIRADRQAALRARGQPILGAEDDVADPRPRRPLRAPGPPLLGPEHDLPAPGRAPGLAEAPPAGAVLEAVDSGSHRA